MFEEMKKLDEMLTKANIPHTYGPHPYASFNGEQIVLFADVEQIERLDDAVMFWGSHGFSEGLMETFCLSDCAGYETAEEVFKGWQKMYLKANITRV